MSFCIPSQLFQKFDFYFKLKLFYSDFFILNNENYIKLFVCLFVCVGFICLFVVCFVLFGDV